MTAVEQTLTSAPGATKKALVMQAITTAAKVGEQVPESHVAMISMLIDGIVGQLNASGIFNHGPSVKAGSSTTAVID